MNKKEIAIILVFVIIIIGFWIQDIISPAFINHKNESNKINWASPTGSLDIKDYYSAEYRIYDDLPASRSKTYTYFDNVWCPFLEITQEPGVCNNIRYYHPSDISAYYDKIDVDVFYDNNWHDVYEGDLEAGWVQKKLPESNQIVEKARIRQHTVGNQRCYLYEFDFGQIKRTTLFSSDPEFETAFKQQTASINNKVLKYLQFLNF